MTCLSHRKCSINRCNYGQSQPTVFQEAQNKQLLPPRSLPGSREWLCCSHRGNRARVRSHHLPSLPGHVGASRYLQSTSSRCLLSQQDQRRSLFLPGSLSEESEGHDGTRMPSAGSRAQITPPAGRCSKMLQRSLSRALSHLTLV